MKKSYIRRVWALAHESQWAILPEKLAEIQSVLSLRNQGVRLSEEQIRARIGDGNVPSAVSAPIQIAVMNLFGTITHRANFMTDFSGGTSLELFNRAFDEAVDNDQVVAILIVADTPGGTVPGVMETSDRIYAARSKKRIVTFIDPMMASAGLWIGTAAGEVISTPSANAIGSIGVLNMHTDNTKALEKAGIEQTFIRSTEFKAEGYGPMTDAYKSHLQERVDAIHRQFVDAVARNRGVSAAKVESDFGRGRTLTAKEALSVGLIDRIATLDVVIAELAAAAGSAGRAGTITMNAGHSQTEKLNMNKQILTALIRDGIVEAGCSDAEYTAGIDKFFATRSIPKPAGDESVIAGFIQGIQAAPKAPHQQFLESASQGVTDFKPGQIDQPNRHSASIRESVSVDDIVATLSIAANIPAETRLSLQSELIRDREGLTHAKLLDRINAAAVAATPKAGANRIEGGEAAVDKFHASARDAILSRTWGASAPKEIYDFRADEMREWKASRRPDYGLMRLDRIVQQCMVHAGYDPARVMALPDSHAAQIAMGSDPANFGFRASDGPAYNVSGMFSNILLDASNVLLRRSYNDTNVSFDQWMRNAPAIRNFKPVNRVIAGELGDPRAVPENGAFEETTLVDSKESYRLTMWGEIFSHSWELIVNDELNSFTEIPMKLGRAMRRKQNRIAYSALKSNQPLMADNVALFDTNAVPTGHNNVTTGAISTGVPGYVTAFNAMTRKMAEQRGLSSESGVLNLMPQYVIYPMALRGIIRQTLGSPSGDATNSGLVNIWQQGLTPIEEGELGLAAGGSDVAFYFAANSGDVDTIEYAYLQGLESPRIEQATAFDRLALRQRIYHAFAAKAIDYRGLQRHDGA